MATEVFTESQDLPKLVVKPISSSESLLITNNISLFDPMKSKRQSMYSAEYPEPIIVNESIIFHSTESGGRVVPLAKFILHVSPELKPSWADNITENTIISAELLESGLIALNRVQSSRTGIGLIYLPYDEDKKHFMPPIIHRLILVDNDENMPTNIQVSEINNNRINVTCITAEDKEKSIELDLGSPTKLFLYRNVLDPDNNLQNDQIEEPVLIKYSP